MSHDPAVHGYHDYVKEARIARRVRKAMHQQDCAGGRFHGDDCGGCNHFLDCARQQEDFSAECICWHCHWLGYYDDCGLRVIHQTYLDPEERYATCPNCGQDVEPVD